MGKRAVDTLSRFVVTYDRYNEKGEYVKSDVSKIDAVSRHVAVRLLTRTGLKNFMVDGIPVKTTGIDYKYRSSDIWCSKCGKPIFQDEDSSHRWTHDPKTGESTGLEFFCPTHINLGFQ